MDYKYIKVVKEDYKFYLILSRPEKRNAFTPTMINEIHHAFTVANEDDEVKVVLIKAEGPVFCAGMDLKTFENADLDNLNPNIINQNISLGEVFDKLYKPSIALVEGNVIAGAFLIVLGCSYVFCKPEVQFRLPELALGIFPFQVMASLLKVMPEKKVLQLCLETEYFDSVKAKEFGIIDGFIDSKEINSLIESFRDVRTLALIEGIKSLRKLQEVAKSDQYTFLKDTLDKLRE